MTASAVANRVIRKTMPAGFTAPTHSYRLRLGMSQKFPATVTNSDPLGDEFRRLADKWRRDTQFYSSVCDMVIDPSYQQIIGKGPAIVPSILRELKKGPDHWYWALGVITQANPAKNVPDGDIGAVCRAWLDW